MLYYINSCIENNCWVNIKVSNIQAYLTGQIVSWNFGKFWKQSLGVVVMCIETCISMIQKELLYLYL